jgi:hypothetical protein
MPNLFESIILQTFIKNSRNETDWIDLLNIYLANKHINYLIALSFSKDYNLLNL